MNISEKLPKESLVRQWVEAYPVTEVPYSYVTFGTFCMLGAALGRRVWMNQDAHTLYPMLNLLLIGPSGTGKSTAIVKIAKPLIDSLPIELKPQFIAGKATPERLHDDLLVEPQSIIFASELANFFSRTKYMEDMIPYVTQLLDYEPQVERRNRSELLVVKEPSVTVVGGSTVDWLQDQLPDSAASGGFLARFLIVKEEHKRMRVADPMSMLSTKQWEDVFRRRELVKGRFRHAVETRGEITFEDGLARDAFSIWYQLEQPLTGALAPFSARAGEFVRRLSMLIAISCGRASISVQDIECAIALFGYASARLQEVVVPFSPAGKLLAKVLEAVGNQPTRSEEIHRALRNFAPAQDVQKMLESLLLSKDISWADGGYIRTRQKDTRLV